MGEWSEVTPPAEKDVPCPEAMGLLDALWDLYWNGPGSADYGDHTGYTWPEMQALDDAAERVETHYVAHGCRPPANECPGIGCTCYGNVELHNLPSALPPAACPCGHPADDHDDDGACMHLCDCAWPDAEKDATRHDPTLCATGRYGCWSYCTCGWKSGLYTTTTGAHQAFGEHLTRVFPEVGCSE